MYKKNKKSKLLICMISLLLVVLAASGYLYHKKAKTVKNTQEEIILNDNQNLKYAKIDTILGNEMTCTFIEDGRDTDETSVYIIPVGTQVVTKLGTTTTFARLSGGNSIKMLTQLVDDGSEEIIKIWIE